MQELDYNKNYNSAKKYKNKILEDIDYPYLKYYTTLETIKKKFKNLKRFKTKIQNTPYRFTTLKINNIKFYDIKKNIRNYFIIINEDIEHEKIGEISDYFNEYCRVRCKFASAVGTPFEYYRNNIDSIIEYLKSINSEITIQSMRNAIDEIGYKKCNRFKPKIMKFFIEYFNARKILDMSSGWGDRLHRPKRKMRQNHSYDLYIL